MGLHLLEQCEALVDVPSHTVALYNGGVGDNVWMHRRVAVAHVLQETRHFMHHAAARQGVEHGVEGNGVAGDATLLHLLVDGHNLVVLPGHGEALDDGGVNHSVDKVALIFLEPGIIHDTPGIADVVIRDQSLHHAAQGDSSELHLLRRHVPPELLHRGHVLSLAKGLHHAAVGGAGDLGEVLLLQQLEALPQQLEVPAADARVREGAEEHLVHGHLALLDQRQDLRELPALRARRDALQENAAGDRAGGEGLALHLLHDAPSAGAVALAHHGIQQGVIGHAAGHEPRLVHLGEGAQGAAGVAARQVAFHEGVVAHHVDQLLFLHLLEEVQGFRQRLALDAGVQQAVVDQDVGLRVPVLLELVKRAEGTLQVALLATGADEPRLAIGIQAGGVRVLLQQLGRVLVLRQVALRQHRVHRGSAHSALCQNVLHQLVHRFVVVGMPAHQQHQKLLALAHRCKACQAEELAAGGHGAPARGLGPRGLEDFQVEMRGQARELLREVLAQLRGSGQCQQHLGGHVARQLRPRDVEGRQRLQALGHLPALGVLQNAAENFRSLLHLLAPNFATVSGALPTFQLLKACLLLGQVDGTGGHQVHHRRQQEHHQLRRHRLKHLHDVRHEAGG
mmetsp:Transcript_2446/g.5754  ORF Transcript_2446/g.5754 Transcript_2446/m.5754 type:complete len:622 (+) Transcript_2446:669-2534(+)